MNVSRTDKRMAESGQGQKVFLCGWFFSPCWHSFWGCLGFCRRWLASLRWRPSPAAQSPPPRCRTQRGGSQSGWARLSAESCLKKFGLKDVNDDFKFVPKSICPYSRDFHPVGVIRRVLNTTGSLIIDHTRGHFLQQMAKSTFSRHTRVYGLPAEGRKVMGTGRLRHSRWKTRSSNRSVCNWLGSDAISMLTNLSHFWHFWHS